MAQSYQKKKLRLTASSTDGFSDLKFGHYAETLQDFIAVVFSNTMVYVLHFYCKQHDIN